MRIFADDCIVYRSIKSADDHQSLQSDLDRINNWCKSWLMTLNISKCKIMSFTRKSVRSLFPYNINNNTLARTTWYKYLGVHLTQNLSWVDHITTISANASRSLGYLRRNLHSTTPHVRKQAYQTFVRPQLEYASSIWSPHQKYLIQKLEAIQNRACRFITRNYNNLSSVTQLKLELSLHPLTTRRDIALLSLFHKYVTATRSPLAQLQRSSHLSHRLHNDFSYTRVYGTTNAFNYSSLPRAIRLWNDLPNSIALQRNHDKFREHLINHFTDNA